MARGAPGASRNWSRLGRTSWQKDWRNRNRLGNCNACQLVARNRFSTGASDTGSLRLRSNPIYSYFGRITRASGFWDANRADCRRLGRYLASDHPDASSVSRHSRCGVGFRPTRFSRQNTRYSSCPGTCVTKFLAYWRDATNRDCVKYRLLIGEVLKK